MRGLGLFVRGAWPYLGHSRLGSAHYHFIAAKGPWRGYDQQPMKAVLFLLIFAPIFSVAQLTPSQQDSARNVAYRQNSGLYKPLPPAHVNVGDELAYMRMCIGRYNKQWNSGFGMQFVGAAASTVGFAAVAPRNYRTGIAVGIGGGALWLVGAIVCLHSRSNLSKFSAGIGGEGVQVIYTF